jgi:hypothetical protein
VDALDDLALSLLSVEHPCRPHDAYRHMVSDDRRTKAMCIDVAFDSLKISHNRSKLKCVWEYSPPIRRASSKAQGMNRQDRAKFRRCK